MARLRDVPVVLRRVGPWKFAMRVWDQMAEDHILVWAAALAYSWLFAIFPFFIFLMTLIPLMPDAQKQQALSSLQDLLRELPNETYNLLNERVTAFANRVLNESHGGLMSLGILLTLWAASGGMAMTMSALDRCYDVDINRPFYKARPAAILMTIVVSVLLLLVLILLPIGTAILNYVWVHLHLPDALYVVLTVARWLLAVLLMTALLSTIYHFGTRVKQQFRFLTPGAAFAMATWTLLGFGFKAYINHAVAKYTLTYGAIGGVVILLFLFYIDAVVLLVGAEINSEIDYEVLGVPPGTLDLRRRPPVSVADPTMPSP